MGGLRIGCGYVVDYANDQADEDNEADGPSADATLSGCGWGPIGE